MEMSFGSPILFSLGSVYFLLLQYPSIGLSMETTDNCSIAISNQNGESILIPWKPLEGKRSFRYSFVLQNGESISIQWKIQEVKMEKKKIKTKLQDAPTEFQVTTLETNLLLTWKPPKEHAEVIKFFYLKVHIVRTSIQHHYEHYLLNVSGIDIQEKSFHFQCVNLSENIKEVRAKIWSLPNPAHGPKLLFKLSKNAIDNPVEDIISVDKEAQESRNREYQCCNELVEVELTEINQSAQVIVKLHTLPDNSAVEVILMNVTTVETRNVNTWTYFGSGGKMNISLNSGILSPGKYKAEVLKICEKTFYTKDTSCMPERVISDTIAIAYSSNELPEAAKQTTADISRDDDMSTFLLWSGLTTSFLVSVFGVSIITVGIAIFFRSRGSKQCCNTKQGNGEENVALCKESVKEDETVAIIYVRDSSEYDKAVDAFQKMLQDLEVKAQTIRFDSSNLINIIDFSETVCRSFKRFIIIVSPDLYQLCHYYKHGDNTMYDRILTKHCGQCLPVVLLNYLNQICFYGRENALVYLVQFFDYGQLGCDYMNMFVSDHLVLSSGFRYCLYKSDDHQELQLKEDTLMALVKHLRSNNMSAIVNGGNMDIRLKTDVECELKISAEAVMTKLKNDSLLVRR